MHTRIICMASLLLVGIVPVAAQEFPTHAVNMNVPFTAGGPTDTLARHLAVAMGSALKQVGSPGTELEFAL